MRPSMFDWFARPRPAPTERRDIPAGLWTKCPRCANFVYRKELERNLRVCPRCGYHHRLSARERLQLVLDAGSFHETDAGLLPEDPLEFVDERPYPLRLEEARRRTVIGAMEFEFLGGSMGSVVGEKVARSAERAAALRCPLILFTASGGARMQEGTLSLLQMAKVSAALGRLHDAGVLYVTVLCDPTT